MCLALPGVLVEFKENGGIVDLFGVRREVQLDFIEDPTLGDRLLIHAGYAINRIDEQHAQEILNAVRSVYGNASELT